MAFRGMSISTRLAIGAVLIIGGLPPANAQFGPRQSGPPYRPAKDAFHSADLHIVEKFTRKGDEILYELTLDDPDVLVEPWTMAPGTLRINKTKDAGLIPERAYCEVYEEGNISTQIRH
jgi:hypothetical protein